MLTTEFTKIHLSTSPSTEEAPMHSLSLPKDGKTLILQLPN